MSVQDQLERILREMHIMVSKGKIAKEDENFVLVNKKEMQKRLNALSQTVSEMMDAYEVTEQSRNRGELEAEKIRAQIIRDANLQAEDIYAASVIYTDDALGRIQDILNTAEKTSRDILHRFNREMEEEKRVIRSNQLELKTQLEDLKDTAKYIKIIEEKNKEQEKAKAEKKNGGKADGYRRRGRQQDKEDPDTQEAVSEADEDVAEITKEPEIVYEKPEIKINEDYFRKAGIPIEEEKTGQKTDPDAKETDSEQTGMSEEEEQALMQELDMEYFQWQNGEKPEPKKKKGRFAFGRHDKS